MKKKYQKNRNIFSDRSGSECSCLGSNVNCLKCNGTGTIQSHSKIVNKNINKTTIGIAVSKTHKKLPNKPNKADNIEDFIGIKDVFHENKDVENYNNEISKLNTIKIHDCKKRILYLHKINNYERCVFCNEKIGKLFDNHIDKCYFISKLSPNFIIEIVERYEITKLPLRYYEKYTRNQIISIIQKNVKSSNFYNVVCPFCKCKTNQLNNHFLNCRVLNKSNIIFLNYFIENAELNKIRVKSFAKSKIDSKSYSNKLPITNQQERKIETELDGSKDYYFNYRENGKFGSHPLHDNYDD